MKLVFRDKAGARNNRF